LVVEEEMAEMLKMTPSRVGGNEVGVEQFSGMIVDGEQQCLFFRGLPPLVNGGVVSPKG